MDYQLENLGPERFQQFCQALLIREHPNVQCFPVAQPDGGRDSILYGPRRDTEEFIIYQVKFLRRPQADPDPHKWLVDTMQKEAPKIKALVAKGAREYYLLTNISGTAHPGSGSIDQLREILGSELGIPVECWWRDDLNRRLDNAWDLKWVYPDVMSGPDVLRSIIESGLSEERERRTAVIRAFLQEQYLLDQEVRFKQVELQNKLLDLFIDVPLVATHNPKDEKRQQLYYALYMIREAGVEADEADEASYVVDWESLSSDYAYHGHGRSTVGAATMLLHAYTQQYIPQVVLEGAPGQGKSTIAQYVCQVHRMRILQKADDLNAVPKQHKSTPVRIPIKVDLRDLATWLDGKDPFSPNEPGATPHRWHKSLESFLAAQVRHHSGGLDFSVDDLHAIARISSLLVVLDGLDEVADISKRKEIVEQVIMGVQRLKANAASLQIIVTSRPAAFANSPGFPEEDFTYFGLDSITKNQISEYANRWLKARRLPGRESAEVKKILNEKLDEPHLRDLARNPMQLAILLSLIHTRGVSLPDKRTALYDSYVELFFNRESEKSSIVREHRDKLIDIHRYLAWVLHSEAEKKDNRGSISSERLKRLLHDYLEAEGQNTELVEELFKGMVERVVALVSRVQGTYEFEVQPLREYFAARHLYDTAPYSPAGAERKGTKPDRFDAIARNFYWLNVTRFYAGCYSKGELPGLVGGLVELSQAEGYRNTNHPRVLAAMLLTDWVFAQYPKSMREVVSLILDDRGLRYLLSQRTRTRGSAVPLSLPKNSGRDELVQRCFTILESDPPWDYALELIGLIKENASKKEIKNIWQMKFLDCDPKEQWLWLWIGQVLDALSEADTSEVESLLARDPQSPDYLQFVFRSRHVSLCETSKERCDITVRAILNGSINVRRHQQITTVLNLFCQAIDGSRYGLAFGSPQPIALSELWKRYLTYPSDTRAEILEKEYSFETLEKCVEVIKVAIREQNRTAKEWASEISPWEAIVEQTRSIWGDQWAVFQLANLASGIRSSKETCKDFPELLDSSRSLCRRARYARLRAGAPDWWKRQLEMASTDLENMVIAFTLLTWGSANTLTNLAEPLGAVLDQFPKKNWLRVIRSARETVLDLHREPKDDLLYFNMTTLPDKLSARAVAALGLRAHSTCVKDLYLKYLANYDEADSVVLKFCQEAVLRIAESDADQWSQSLAILAKTYKRGVYADTLPFSDYRRYPRGAQLPISAVEEISEHPHKYPLELLALAEIINRKDVASKIIPVAEIAQREGWFRDQV